MTGTTEQRTDTRDGVLVAAAIALMDHIATHHLPFPIDMATPYDGAAPYLRVRVPHAGDQMRWLNTVHVDGEDREDRGEYASITWHVRLPDTGTRIELVGTRSHLEGVSA
jgi:hypothetical protein